MISISSRIQDTIKLEFSQSGRPRTGRSVWDRQKRIDDKFLKYYLSLNERVGQIERAPVGLPPITMEELRKINHNSGWMFKSILSNPRLYVEPEIILWSIPSLSQSIARSYITMRLLRRLGSRLDGMAGAEWHIAEFKAAVRVYESGIADHLDLLADACKQLKERAKGDGGGLKARAFLGINSLFGTMRGPAGTSAESGANVVVDSVKLANVVAERCGYLMSAAAETMSLNIYRNISKDEAKVLFSRQAPAGHTSMADAPLNPGNQTKPDNPKTIDGIYDTIVLGTDARAVVRMAVDRNGDVAGYTEDGGAIQGRLRRDENGIVTGYLRILGGEGHRSMFGLPLPHDVEFPPTHVDVLQSGIPFKFDSLTVSMTLRQRF
jgi:hypothetical protein